MLDLVGEAEGSAGSVVDFGVRLFHCFGRRRFVGTVVSVMAGMAVTVFGAPLFVCSVVAALEVAVTVLEVAVTVLGVAVIVIPTPCTSFTSDDRVFSVV